MALERQLIPIPLAGGIDNKTDDKQVPIGKLSVLENGVFSSPKKIVKRNGFSEIGTNNSLITEPTDYRQVATFKNELIAINSNNLYTYMDQRDGVLPQGALYSCNSIKQNISASTYSQESCIYAYWSAINAHVFVYGQRKVDSATIVSWNYTVIDSLTGAKIIDGATLSSFSGYIPKQLVVIGTKCYLIGTKTGTGTKIDYMLSTQPEYGFTGVSAITISSLYAINATASSTLLYVLYDSGVKTYTVRSYNTSLVQQATVDFTTTDDMKAFGYSSGNCHINVNTNDSNQVIVAYPDSGSYLDITKFKFIVYSSSLVLSIAAQTITTAATGYRLKNITSSYEISGGFSYYNFFLEEYNTTDSYKHRIRVITYDSVYTYINDVVLANSLKLASSAKFDSTLGFTILPLRTSYTQQNSYLLCGYTSATLYFISRNLYRTGSSDIEYYPLYTVSAFKNSFLESGKFYFAGYEILDASGIYDKTGVCRLEFDFNSTNGALKTVEAGNNLLISGGILSAYDSSTTCEQNFLYYPTIISVTPLASGSDSYSYIATYEWTDSLGQRHISATSASVVNAAHGSTSADVKVTTLIPTKKTNVEICVYRTEKNGSTYYRCRKLTDPIDYNDTSDYTVTVRTTLSDSDLLNQPQLYITGGVLDNFALSSNKIICLHKNRVFAVDSENPNNIYYSKKISDSRTPVEFCEAFVLTVDSSGGPITALGSMDDKLIIFKKDRYFVLLGQGPDNLGMQNDYIDVQPIVTDVGCNSQKSVLMIPDGLMFYSDRGFYLLDRSLQAQFIGYDVSDSPEDYVVIGSALVPNLHQARFALYNNTTTNLFWVYDYLMKQWSKFTGLNPQSMTSWSDSNNSNHFILLSKQSVVGGGTTVKLTQETPTRSLDFWNTSTEAGTWITFKIITGWMNLAAIGGFQRVRRMIVTGNVAGESVTLWGNIYYDYDETISDYFSIDANSAAGSEFTGRLHFEQQKCRAIKIGLYDEESADPATGKGADISSLTLEVGVKKGTNKVPAANTFTKYTP